MTIHGFAPLLQVFDLPESIRFYRDILGFQVIESTEDWAMLRLDGAELMLNTAYESHERPPRPDPSRIEAHADTALFFGCPDVDAACAHLRAAGLDVKDPVVRDYGMKQVYVNDPDGYNLCFQWPAAAEPV